MPHKPAIGGDGLPVRLDPSQLTQVLLNLAVNARDAMPDGGTLTISTSRVRVGEDNRAQLRVWDEDEGMHPEVLERALEPFFTTKAREKGSGLGLAVCFGIVQRSGGTMSIESAPGQGTIVTISLPLDQSPRVDRPVVPVKGRSEGVGRTALVVDDIPEVRSVIARMLRDLGFEVVEAGSGREALSKLAEIEGDLVLVSDVAMKGMSGADLALEAWKDHPELPVVFMSGYTGDRLDERTTRRRGVRFLSKPFTPDELAIKIAEAISERA